MPRSPDEQLLHGLLGQLIRDEPSSMQALVHEPTVQSPGPSESLRGRKVRLTRMLEEAIHARQAGLNLRHIPGLLSDAVDTTTRPLRQVRAANENFISTANSLLARPPGHPSTAHLDPLDLLDQNISIESGRRKTLGSLARVDQELTRRGDILRRMSRVLRTGKFTGPLAVLMLLPMLAAMARDDSSGDEVVGEGLF